MASHPGDAGDAKERDTAYELFQRGSRLLAQRHPGAAAIVLERASRLEPGKASILASYPAMGYSQVQILAAGIKAAGTTKGSAVAAKIAKFTNFRALIGKTNYAWRKQCNVPAGRPFLIFQVQHGKESFLKAMVPKHVNDRLIERFRAEET